MLQRTANSALPLIDLGVLNINESFIVCNLQLQRMLFLDTFSTVWCIDYTCLDYGSLQTGNLWTWIVICLDALFILRIIHCLCMTKLLISTHWYNLKVMVKFVWVNIDNLVKSSDLLNCDRFLDCSVRSKKLIMSNDWIDIELDQCWRKSTVLIWGQRDDVYWNWCQTSHFQNFNISPQCFHHTLDVDSSFWWFGLIPHKVNC